MNIYELSRAFWNYAFEHPDTVKPNHIALYFFALEHCNRLGWKEKFGFPTGMVKDAIGIKSYNTYKATLNELVEMGFITMIEKSTNQYSANIIALSKNDKSQYKALDKAMIEHSNRSIKKEQTTVQSTSESTAQSKCSIDIPIYQSTNTPINNVLLEKEPKEICSESKTLESDIEEIKTETSAKEKSSAKKERFKPPNIEEVKAYCFERQNKVNAESFIDFYESKGWMVGKNKMKNWQAAVRTWEKTRENGATNYKKPHSGKISGRATLNPDYIHPEFT